MNLLAMFLLTLGPGSLVLTPDGRLGGERLVLGAGTTMVVGQGDQLFLLDPAAFQVRVFDRELRSLRVFGRRGKGPGEFEEPSGITLTPAGHLAVVDPTSKRVTLFTPQGELKQTFRLDVKTVAAYHPVMSREDRIAYLGARSDMGKPVYDLAVFDTSGNVSRTLQRIHVTPRDWSKSTDPSFWVDFLRDEFSRLETGLPLLAKLEQQGMVYGLSNTYQLHFCDPDGRPLSRRTHALERVSLSERARRALLESVWNRLTTDPYLFAHMPRSVFEKAASLSTGPQVLPALTAITALGPRIGVLVHYAREKREGRLDLLDAKGELVAQGRYQGPADCLAGTRDHLYAVGPDQEGEMVLVRYRMQY